MRSIMGLEHIFFCFFFVHSFTWFRTTCTDVFDFLMESVKRRSTHQEQSHIEDVNSLLVNYVILHQRCKSILFLLLSSFEGVGVLL